MTRGKGRTGTVNVRFMLKDPKGTSKTAVRATIRYMSKEIRFYTGLSIQPRHWESKKTAKGYQRALSSMSGAAMFNDRLNVLQGKIESLYNQFMLNNDNTPPSKEMFKVMLEETVNGNKKEQITFMSWLKTFIQQRPSKVNSKTNLIYNEATVKKYRTCFKRLQEFQLHNGIELDFNSFNKALGDSFIEYLTLECSYRKNTVGKYMATLKTFLNQAQAEGIMNDNSFKSYSIPKEDLMKIYLSEDELSELRLLDLTDRPHLEKIRSLFLLSCGTALRFSDFVSFRPEYIHGDLIKMPTFKGKGHVTIPILPEFKSKVLEILDEAKTFIPESITNQYFNRAIKELCAGLQSMQATESYYETIGGVNKLVHRPRYEMVSAHTGRRTYLTLMYKKSVPVESLQRISGHKSKAAFLRYLCLNDDENALFVLDFIKNPKEVTPVFSLSA